MAIWKRKEGGNVPAESNSEKHVHGEDCNGHGHRDDDGELEFEITSTGERKSAPKFVNPNTESENGDEWDFVVVLEGHDAEIKQVAYSASGQWLASCSRDKSVWIWEETGEEGDDEWETVAVLNEHSADVKCVSWRKDDGNGEVLASGSYDDTIRFYRDDGEGEWTCIAVLEGHESTIWSMDWEPEVSQEKFGEEREEGDYAPRIPRLISASADHTIRVWKKAPTPPPPNRPSYINSGIPSTMRPGPSNETWECSAILPKVHDLPIYSVSWSKKSGLVVSSGGDGKVAIYEEITTGRTSVGGPIQTEWKVVAISEGGHGSYEINHVTWSPRFDPGRRGENEEMIITTGDDGVARAWAIESIAAPAVVTGDVPLVQLTIDPAAPPS